MYFFTRRLPDAHALITLARSLAERLHELERDEEEAEVGHQAPQTAAARVGAVLRHPTLHLEHQI